MAIPSFLKEKSHLPLLEVTIPMVIFWKPFFTKKKIEYCHASVVF